MADEDTKTDLCERIAGVAGAFAPSPRWHIDTLIKVLAVAGSYDRSGIDSTLLVLVSQHSDLYSYVVHKLFTLLSENTAQLPLVHVALWCIGEYGEMLAVSPTQPPADAADDSNSTGAEGEPREPAAIVDLVHKCMRMHNSGADTRGRCLTALLKLSTRLTGDELTSRRIREVCPAVYCCSVRLLCCRRLTPHAPRAFLPPAAAFAHVRNVGGHGAAAAQL